MAKKERRGVTRDQVISTLVYIRHLSDALIATLMADSGAEFSKLPQPLFLKTASGGSFRKDCPPPSVNTNCPTDDWPVIDTIRTRFSNCPEYRLTGPVKIVNPRFRKPAAK